MAMSRRCFRWEAVFMGDVVEFDDGRVLTMMKSTAELDVRYDIQ
jgi:hypothetical protein